MTISETLNAAADYIEAHGWITEELVDSDGHVCLMGSIGAVVCGNPETEDYSSEYEAVYDYLRDHLANVHPAEWNDTVPQSQDEVVAMLRAAA